MYARYRSPGVMPNMLRERLTRTYTFDDRVSENIIDVEDEWAEVDIVVRGMIQDGN